MPGRGRAPAVTLRAAPAAILRALRAADPPVPAEAEADKKTLQILLLKMWGFSIREISAQTGMPEKTIYTRMDRLKKKIKKFLKNFENLIK